MSALLLAVIYLVFISLGLPDSLIGSSWPVISAELQVDEGMQGAVTIIVSAGTIISSFATGWLNRKLKPYGTVVVSILLTVTGLLGFFFSKEFYHLCLAAVPLGLGAGAIDATLNNYVANNYKAIQLNFLHAFWGLGAAVSPLIISEFLTNGMGWRYGALTLGAIQGAIFLIALSIIPIWRKADSKRDELEQEEASAKLGFFKTFRINGVALAVIGFFCYIAVEQTSLNWFSSYAVFGFAVEENIASRWASYFFIAITAGRMLSGILSLKIKDHNLMRIGEGIIAAGILLLAIGGANPYLLPVGISLVGLGCAPVYPSIIHSTPTRFTPSFSASVMAVQIGCAYLSNVSASPLFGVIGQYAGFVYYPYYLLAFLVVLTLCNEAVRYKQRRGVCGTLKSNTTSN
ncbi:MAG TPA: MFS transporter [Candidatus Enteromonas pullicola]|uniref:MFS transporter n=1 Tax=Candidatus Alloenteromonas pullicola TaxID=2840784 RepID=A0A9D1LP56_9FIRM|nr:MFS transporter [Candidatus Enteromonas pullicola]